ncbi:MAG: hypothetical protein J2P17_20360 [Mycobacterium sp.]|nr:hypothetical protein [Mycobacterium sp.]
MTMPEGGPNDRRRERAVVNDTLPRLRVDAQSDDGCVAVTVSWEGVLIDASLSDSAATLPSKDLAARLLQAYSKAQREAAWEVKRLLPSTTNSNNWIAQRLRWRETWEAELKEPEGAPPSRVPARESATVSRPPAASYDDDDSFDDINFLAEDE